MLKQWMKYCISGVLGLTLVACGTGEQDNGEVASTPETTGDEPIEVMTTFYPMYEFAREVGGDRANVQMMLDAGEDAHTFEPSAQDVAKVSEADVFVYSSEEMEFWVPSLLESVENPDLTVARAADGIDLHEHHDHEEDDHDHAHGEDEHHHDYNEHDHAHDEAAQGESGIVGVQGHYHTGDTATLKYESTAIDAHELHWEVTVNGEVTEEVTTTADESLEYTLTEDGATVAVAVYDAEGNTVAEETVQLHVDDHEAVDPHTWLDLVYAQEQVDVIKDAFIEADPAGEDVYEQNAQDFKAQLQALHEEYEEALKDAEHRNFVVQHEAFGHFAQRYNLNQIAIGGLSTEVEPSPSRIAEVGRIVEEYDVPVIYYQQGADSSIAQTVADETGTEVAQLFDLEVLSDQADSYLDAMKQNLEQLKLSIR
ncbi:metal ABC transporter solute-binding protein, Zn/Mn family [Dolosigranulum pigrum]|uniref:metal ABC transporter solute-binding protein, Zn/Mn family n=1 Tax=Dolosigranulum pigrum TaxID=29394 RepID=UPI001AD8781B|nr:zinc ABC transporter substrate-binding protein [Dolosigranulum pigrum]